MLLAETLLLLPFLISGAELTSSGHVAERSDDLNPLEAVVSRLTQDVSRLEARLVALENDKVTQQDAAQLEARLTALENEKAKKAAFVGTFDTDVAPNAPIHFKLINSVGSGYDPITGVYTAPYSGWYSFDIQVFPHSSSTDTFYVDFFCNGGIRARACCYDNADTSFTCNTGITMHVNAGDKVWVQSPHSTVYWHAAFDNIFSGVLVVPDDE